MAQTNTVHAVVHADQSSPTNTVALLCRHLENDNLADSLVPFEEGQSKVYQIMRKLN
jgi:hypothetical protein